MRSAGLLPFRTRRSLEVLLAHPGGPYFAKKDAGAWSVIKGLVSPDETDEDAAAREFREETGWAVPDGDWVSLGETKLRSGKTVVAWAVEADFDPATIQPGVFHIGHRAYPEIDRVEWVPVEEAKEKLNPAQRVFLGRLSDHISDHQRSTR